MSKRQSLNKRFSRHGRSSNFSGIVNPDSNIIDDDNPLWWKNLDGDSIMARRSMRLSIANRASTSLDPESRIESFEFSKEWWKNIDETEKVTSIDHNSVSKSKNESSLQDKDASDNCEPSDVSNKNESIYKKKHALFVSKKRKSHGTNNFSSVLNETSITNISEPPATRSRKEIASDNSYLSYNDATLNKYKKILRNHKRLSGHGAVNDTHKTMEDNSLNPSNKGNNDSSRESDQNGDHVIKSKRILRSTKNKEITENVFDDLLSEDKNVTSKRSIENANESEDSVERSIKKSRLNIFKKKRVSLSASMVQKAVEDNTMEESNEQNLTAENDPASNANNLSMSLTQMTETLHSKLNNSEKKSFNSKTKEPTTPSKLENQSNISELLNHSKALNPSIILTHSPALDNLVLDVGSRSLIHRGPQNGTYQEQNSQHKGISKNLFNTEAIDESQNHSKSKNVNRLIRKINKKKTTTPKRQTRLSTTPHKKMQLSHTEKKDLSAGSDADNSSSESEILSIAKRKNLTVGSRKTRSTASLNRINESHRSDMNQSENTERFRMTRSRSKSNIQDSPKSVNHSHKSYLNLRSKSPDKSEETIENMENIKSTNNSPVLLSSNKSISRNQVSTVSDSPKNPVTESRQDMHHSFENNQNNSKNPEESPEKSQNKSLNKKSERPINSSHISTPKKSITHNKEGTKNDEIKSDENDLPKSKPNFFRKLRKSLAADAFDNILASKSNTDSKTNTTIDEIRTNIPRDNDSPISSITERSDVDFCPDTPSTSNLKMGPISQSTPYNKKIVPSTPSTMKRISSSNFVNGMFQIESSISDQPNTSENNKINDKISNILEDEPEINKSTQNNETIIDKNIPDSPSVSRTVRNVVKKPQIISTITPHLKISRIMKKQTVLNQTADQGSKEILQDKDKMAEIKKVLENIKKRELEKIDRYLTKVPAEQINNPTIPNKGPFQLKNKESIKKTKQVDKAYIVNGKVYKRAKLPRPKSWATNRLYEYLWKRLESKYKLNTRVRSEKFILQLADVVSLTIRRKKYENYRKEVDALMNDMARLEIIKTRNDFYDFCYDFLPYEFRVKATPILLPGNVMSIPYDPKLLHTPILND